MRQGSPGTLEAASVSEYAVCVPLRSSLYASAHFPPRPVSSRLASPHNPMTLALAIDHRKGLALSGLGMLIISPDALLIRLIEDAGHWEIAFYRTLFMALSMTVVMVVRGRRELLGMLRRKVRPVAISALLMAGSNIAFVAAITHTSVANTLLILATVPIFGALFGWAMLRERVAPRTIVAMVVAFAGIALIVGSPGSGELTGDLIAVAAAACLGLNIVVVRRAGSAIIVPSMAFGGTLAALITVFFADAASVGGRDLAILVYLGLIQLPLALGLFYAGARYLPPAEVGLMALIETVLGPLWAWAGVGERPGAITLLGGALVIAAIAGNAALALRNGRVREPT